MHLLGPIRRMALQKFHARPKIAMGKRSSAMAANNIFNDATWSVGDEVEHPVSTFARSHPIAIEPSRSW